MPCEAPAIRDGAPDDLPALVRLDATIDTTWRLQLEREGSVGDLRLRFSWAKSAELQTRNIEYSVESLGEDLARSELFLVAAHHHDPVAFAMLGTNWNRTAEIVDIIVDAAWRGRGVGSALLDRASTFATERHLRAVQWEIQSDNRIAIEFALRRGFRLGGYHDAFYHNDGYESQSRPGFRGLALFLTLPIAP